MLLRECSNGQSTQIITSKIKTKPELKKNLHLDAVLNTTKKHEPASRCCSGSAQVAKVFELSLQLVPTFKKKKHPIPPRAQYWNGQSTAIINSNIQLSLPIKKKTSISMPLRAQYWNGTSNEIITTNILLLCAWAVPSVVIIAITAAKGIFGL
jgi:hypothetical protein